MDFLKGYKTYIVIGLFVALFVVGLLLPEGQIIPAWAWGILSALGLGAIRAAIQHLSGNAGWKTYAAALVVLGVSVLNLFGVVLPLEIIYTVCGALGLLGVRDAIGELRPQTA